MRGHPIDMTVKASGSGGSASPQQVKVRTVTEFSDFGTEAGPSRRPPVRRPT
ncbi:Lipoprotein OS=Streptomyces fumanus OX=67302 GN=GCM10018772_27940 PE=4 SV=1 [Streptomyces fumanus]